MNRSNFIDFESKWVVVTGATSGIGRQIAVELGNWGAKLLLVGRNETALQDVAADIATPEAQTFKLDLHDMAGIEPALRSFAKQKGRIYGLCNAAGIVETRPLTACNTDHLQKMLNINLIAGIEMARVISRRDVMEDSGGAILFVSSIYGSIGVPGQIGYCASKGAVISAVRAMAVELARRNIRVNSISPGFVTTQMTENATAILTENQVASIKQKHPLRTGTPEDVARAAAFLLAPQNSWFTGADIIIDGGYTAQ